MTDGPRIYVASLSDYNAGRLHGVWIDATQDAEDIQEAVTAMLTESREPNAEEWAIHDYEGFHGLKLGEWESFEKVSELGRLIEEHGGAYAAYVANEGTDYATAEGFEESYAGEWSSVEEYAADLVEEGIMGEEIRKANDEHPGWVDMEQIARDLVIGGDIWTADNHDGGIWVFRSI